MKFKLTEQEKKEIRILYEQDKVKSKVAKLDNIAVSLLPSEFIKQVNNEILNHNELVNKIEDSFDTSVKQNPLQYLNSKGITPYLFVVPDFTSMKGEGFPTTGLSVKIDNTPFTINLNLGTNPKDILNSLKFTQAKIEIPIK